MIDLADRISAALDADTAHLTVTEGFIKDAARRGRRRQWRVRTVMAASPMVVVGAVAASIAVRSEGADVVLPTDTRPPSVHPSSTSSTEDRTVDVDGVRLPVPDGFRLISVSRTFVRSDGDRTTRALFAPPSISDAEAAHDGFGCVRVSVLRGGPADWSPEGFGQTRRSEYVGRDGRRGPLWFTFIRVSPSVVLEIFGMATPEELDLRKFADSAVDSGRPGPGPVEVLPTSGDLG